MNSKLNKNIQEFKQNAKERYKFAAENEFEQ